jgi:hypothetical protein
MPRSGGICRNFRERYTANGRRLSMAGPEQENTQRDVPATFYQLIREQTQPSGRGSPAGIVACALFVVIGVLLILALEFGADIEQILIGVFAIAAVNLVLAIVWLSTTRNVP